VIEFLPKAGDFCSVKPKRIRLFIKPYCPWCHRASRWLNERGVVFETVDVTGDETAYDEMIRLSGQELAPVIEVNGKVLADFGPEQLAVFWAEVQPQIHVPAHR